MLRRYRIDFIERDRVKKCLYQFPGDSRPRVVLSGKHARVPLYIRPGIVDSSHVAEAVICDYATRRDAKEESLNCRATARRPALYQSLGSKRGREGKCGGGRGISLPRILVASTNDKPWRIETSSRRSKKPWRSDETRSRHSLLAISPASPINGATVNLTSQR